MCKRKTNVGLQKTRQYETILRIAADSICELYILPWMQRYFCESAKLQTTSSQDRPAGSFEPAGLLIFFIYAKMHPFAQRCFVFSIALVQTQIAAWIVELTGLLPLPEKRSFRNV